MLLAGITLLASPVQALNQANVDLSGEKFGNGVSFSATSEGEQISAATKYNYQFTGTCHGNGALSGFVPVGTKIESFTSSLDSGSSLFLAGTLDNPTGKLPAVLTNSTFSGSESVGFFGRVSVSMKLKIEILASGKVVASITNVSFRHPLGSFPGTIEFDKGAKITVTIPPPPKNLGSVNLSGTRFGNGKSLSATSGKTTILPSRQYKHQVVGMCQGTGDLSKVVPANTNFISFVESIAPGTSASINGTFKNSGGKLPVVLFNRKIAGIKKVKGIGDVLMSMKFKLEILADGQISASFSEVSVKSRSGRIAGTIRFGNGAKAIVSTAPVIEMKNVVSNVSEGAGFISLKVTRSGFKNQKVSVKYATSDDSALAGKHYTATSGTISFPAGVTEGTITIAIRDNTVARGSRRFNVTLSAPGGGALLGSMRSTVVSIVDDD